MPGLCLTVIGALFLAQPAVPPPPGTDPCRVSLCPGPEAWVPLDRPPVLTFGCPEPPFWYFETDIGALKRDADNEHLPMAALDSPDRIVLATDDLDFEFRPAGHVLLGRMFSPRFGIEFDYLGADSWDVEAAYRDTTANALGGEGNLFSPLTGFGNPPVAGLDYNTLASIGVWSILDSYQLNLRQRLPMPLKPMQVSFLYGLRYADIRERFDFATTAEVPLPLGARNRVNVRTDNDLFGLQFGALAEFHVEPRWWIHLRMLAALTMNDASQETTYVHTDELGVAHPYLARKEKDGTGLIGEISLTFVYYITPRLATRLGYRALWVDGVALAAENFVPDVDVLHRGPAVLVDDGTVVYHGPFFGLGLEW